jgi:hypothetical protein
MASQPRSPVNPLRICGEVNVLITLPRGEGAVSRRFWWDPPAYPLPAGNHPSVLRNRRMLSVRIATPNPARASAWGQS